jgi:hypothetical protein
MDLRGARELDYCCNIAVTLSDPPRQFSKRVIACLQQEHTRSRLKCEHGRPSMKWLPDWIVGLSVLIALLNIVLAAHAVYPQTSTRLKWQRECCIAGLALGLVSWLSGIGIIVISELRADFGPLIPGLLLVGIFTTPVALVMGVATKAKPGHLLVIAEAAQALFWVTLWMSAARGV